MPPKVPFRGECLEVAVQVDLRAAEPSPVPYAHEPDPGERSPSGLASGAAEAQHPVSYLLIKDVLRSLAAKGYSIVDSLGFLALIYLGYPVGSVLALPIVERVERKVLVALAAAGMGVTGLLWGFSDSPALVVVWGVLFTVIRNVFSSAFHIFMAELYPTALRATAVGSAYSIRVLASRSYPSCCCRCSTISVLAWCSPSSPQPWCWWLSMCLRWGRVLPGGRWKPLPN